MSKKSSNFANEIAKQEKQEQITTCMHKLALNIKQTVVHKARVAVEAMREISEQNGNSEMTLEDINNEIRQARRQRYDAVVQGIK